MERDLLEDLRIRTAPGERSPRHYHGGVVRRLFLVAGVIMIVTLPLVSERISIPLFTASLFTVLVIGVGAGFLSPRQRWVIIADLLISALAFIVFAFAALDAYFAASAASFFFWVNQTLALVFFFALYFASKTLRGKFFDKGE